MSRKIILIKQELLLLVYELNRSGLLAENEKIRPILAQLEKLLLCDLSPSSFYSVKACRVIYTLSLHDALPISTLMMPFLYSGIICTTERSGDVSFTTDRKSTRLNSSHSQISYAVFCLKKKSAAREALTLRPFAIN